MYSTYTRSTLSATALHLNSSRCYHHVRSFEAYILLESALFNFVILLLFTMQMPHLPDHGHTSLMAIMVSTVHINIICICGDGGTTIMQLQVQQEAKAQFCFSV